MRKTSILLSILVLAAMVLAACGAEETSVPVTDVPPITAESTETMMATEMPTMEGTATGEPGVPVTGDINPARLSNELEFPVLSRDGQQIGEVDDMVLDLDNSSIAYVVVMTDDQRTIAVPWTSLTLQTGTGTGEAVSTPSGDATAAPEATGEATTDPAMTQPAATEPAVTDSTATADAGTGSGTGLNSGQNAFILQIDEETFMNAPEFDSSMLPEMGQSAGDWDADISSYWQGGGIPADSNTPSADGNTPAPDGTAVPEMTATTEGTTSDQATMPATEAPTTDQGTGTGQGQALQGVVLASEVLGSTLTMGQDAGGTGTDQATATPGTGGTDQSTATPDAGTGSGTDTDQGTMSATIEDLIVDTDAGDIQYIVVNTSFDDGEHWIPVPLDLFQWDAATGGFILNVDGTMLQNAPFFQDGQFPDTSMDGWNSEFDSFWQNNGAGGGTGSDSGGADATATP